MKHLPTFYKHTLKIIRPATEKTISFHIQKTFSSKVPELTKDRYPVKRGNFNQITERHVDYFRKILSPNGVMTSSEDVEPYNVDWIRIVRGMSKVVLRPKTTEEVSEILKVCNAEKLAICPQSGNTGLVGGSVPVFDEIVLSLSLMNNIEKLDKNSGVIVCQSGCILENLDTYLRSNGLMMPLDLGAKASCLIGGNISTNAGGLRLLRYGSLQGSVLGLEVVLANGEVLDLLNCLKKDNTGYHLKHLFIGSEGTLGIVTKVAVQCPPAPISQNVAFLGLNSFSNVLKTYTTARSNLGEILSSCELIDSDSLEICLKYGNVTRPLLDRFPFYMLIETSGSNAEHDLAKLQDFLGLLMEKNIISDGTSTNEPSKIQALWKVRENITESLTKDGYVFKYDISLPLEDFYNIVHAMKERLKNANVNLVCGYGHVGDGNIHLNITCPEFTKDILNLIEPFIFQWTAERRGSVSAEHGIGFKKTQFLKFSKPPEAIRIMKDIKLLLDPNGILNPYKVLPNE